MKSKVLFLIAILCVVYLCQDKPQAVIAKNVSPYSVPELTTTSMVNVDQVFGLYQKQVDEQLYYSMCYVDDRTLVRIFGNINTPMFNKAKETINPCMAFATTWGEAGCSYPGISLTTIMDFSPSDYKTEIDWITISQNLQEVDSCWYLANAIENVNVNEEGYACGMPCNLLQIPSSGSRANSKMTDLGVGPYQITSSDWNKYDLDCRVNPVYGFEQSLGKIGTSWYKCGINPISDLTVYACFSLGHQGGGLIDYQFGKDLINIINRPDVQDAFYEVGYQMYIDALDKASKRRISTADINLNNYLPMLESKVNIDFSDYTGGPGKTNKGNYTVNHCLRYCFYKYYFGMN